MQLSSAIASCLLAATTLASPVHHAHKREAEAAIDYVTVYNTFYVTDYGNGAPSASATPVAVQKPVEVSSVAVETSSVAPVETSPAAPAETSSILSFDISSVAPVLTATSTSDSALPIPTKTSSSAPAATSSAPSVGDAGALGITYSPYSNSGGCKSASQVAKEVAELSGYNIIRLYGSDCSQVQNVYKAKAAGQKLFLGVYHMGNIENELQTIHDALNGDWSDVVTVSIGNELVNSGQATVDQVAGYLKTGRAKLTSLGYTGKVVSVDTFIATINNPGLCALSDYMAVNAHAYFDGGVTSSEAGPWAELQIQRVWSACGGKKSVTIVESGWPSQGDTNGKAVASPSDQTAAIASLKKSIGNDVYLFTAFNDKWKSPGYLSVEQWFGIYGTSSN